MQIFVDADACPVVGIVEKMAEKYNIPTTLLCDTNHVLYSDCNKILCMLSDCVQPFFIYVINIFLPQIELLRNLKLSSSSNNCLYHSSLVIKTSMLA